MCDEFRKCEFCGCDVYCSQRACCDAGRKADIARHILKGDKKRRDTDYGALHEDLHNEAKHLKADLLQELIYQAKVLRARQGGLPVPVRDKRPKEAELGPCTALMPDEPPAGFDGTQKNPMPLGDGK